MKPTLWLAFVLISSGNLWAQSSSSKTNKVDQTPASQTGTNAYQGITEASPLFVKIEPTEDVKSEAAIQARDEKRDRWDRRMDYATIALAFITFALAVFTGGLWYHTYKLVRGAEEAAKKELRAYIGITDISVEKDGVVVKFLNSGSTPAHNVFPQGWLSVGKKLTKEFIKEDSIKKMEKYAGKISGSTIWKGIESSMLIKEKNTEMMKNGFVTFVCGYISYTDVFGDDQYACFQFEMEWRNEEWKFATCVGSNEAS